MNVVPAVWIPSPRPAASVELRCGVLYSGCQCVRRNGLQQDCPRSECQGRASCLDYPAPTCVPSGNAPTMTYRRAEGPESLAQRTERYLDYKKKLDNQYVRIGRKWYRQNPPVDLRDNVPCRVHIRK